jgi:hypothetical protein
VLTETVLRTGAADLLNSADLDRKSHTRIVKEQIRDITGLNTSRSWRGRVRWLVGFHLALSTVHTFARGGSNVWLYPERAAPSDAHDGHAPAARPSTRRVLFRYAPVLRFAQAESDHHSTGRESAGESLAPSRIESWRFTPLALDTACEQRARTVEARPQYARVSADVDEPRWHQPPRVRPSLTPR